MATFLSKERRIIFWRKVKGFWEEFSHNRIGFFGLVLLLVFVGMAVFAPWLTPYDPITESRVADGYAMPEWMMIFPQYRDYPRTMDIHPYWEVGEESDFVEVYPGREVECIFHMTGEIPADPETFTLTTSFHYPYVVQPNRISLSFDWIAKNLTNVWYSSQLFLINPNGNATRMWKEAYTDLPRSLSVLAESTDYWLIKSLGYTDPKAINLAHLIFAEPVEGEYRLVLQASIRPDEGVQMASARLTLRNFRVFVPGLVHGILGTDFSGADVWAQLVYGSRISLIIGLLAAGLATSMGVLVGVVSGYLGGAVDEGLMRVVDILLCLPGLPLLLTLVKLFGKNVFYIVIFIALFGWLGLSRTIRSQVLSLRETAFVECAVASGASKPYIMFKHLVPNIAPIALASLVLSVPGGILMEASLSFLGFGDPRVPTWGKMLNYAFGHGAFEEFAWWWALPPGIAITLVCLAFVFMGFAIDEVVNPRLRRRR
jgi:ABC-type dipeptide/oligopeptide/nickel transport system permease subunit